MQKRHLPGLSVAIIKNGRILESRGYGLASLEHAVPAAAHSVYRIGSLTKTFTAIAVMLLAEDGKLGLDDSIRRYVADAPASWSSVTVRHLLTHTSGLLREATPYSFDTVGKFYSRDDYLAIARKAPLEFQPGEKWSYSNVGYYLLATIVERASGRTYADFLVERIFSPLRMTSTYVESTQPWFLQEVVKDRVTPYQWDPNARAFRVPLDFNPSQLFGCGNILSSVADLAKLEIALGEGRLLRASSLEQMRTPVRLASGNEVGYGFGWTMFNPVGFSLARETFRGHRVEGHGGNTPGFSSRLVRFPDDHVSIIVLCNTLDGDVSDSRFQLSLRRATLVIPGLAIPHRAIADTDPDLTERVERILRGIADGTLDAASLSPRLSEALPPDRLVGIKQGFAERNGLLKSIALLERRAQGEYRVCLFRAVFEKRRLLCYVRATKEGVIDDLGWEPEAE